MKLEYTYDLQYDKTNMENVYNKDSDQPGHPPSLIRDFAVCLELALTCNYPLSAQLPRLIFVFAWHTSHFVDFVVS